MHSPLEILVTGAAGFVGSHLAEELARRGHRVSGIDSFTPYYPVAVKRANAQELEACGVRVAALDLAVDELRSVVEEADIVYHLAAQPGISSQVPFEDYLRNNVVATERLVDACERSARLRAFIYASTSSVYGKVACGSEDTVPEPASHYGVTKLAGEQLALWRHRERGFPAASLRLFSVYGPRERPDKLFPRLMRSALTGEEFPLYEGSAAHTRSFTFVGDAVAALATASERLESCLGQTINIGSDEEFTTADAMALVEDILGRKVNVVPAARRAGDQLRTRADISKARKCLDYDPATTLEEGLRAQAEWFRAHGVR